MFNRFYILLLLTIGVLCCVQQLGKPLFDDGLSKVVYDRDGILLGASISQDGQWRFPERDGVPTKFSRALLEYEDKRFFFHRGVDAKAVGRAIYLNLQKRKIVSGASTITMQVARMSRKNRPRNFIQKGIETWMAILMECTYTKREILSMYSSHAPFGGNVVGLDAAAWRYFNKSPEMLTWAEAATLAVLPNAPGLIHPGRNRELLLYKRNELLRKLNHSGAIDSFTLELSLLEPLPEKPYPLPVRAPHLMARITGSDGIMTTIDGTIQQQILTISDDHHRIFTQKGIENHGILIVDNSTAEVIAYVGNTRGHKEENHVDMVQANRSTGSILKPFLYAAMLQSGKITPDQMLADVPTSIQGFNPKNYNKSYAGAVKASTALARSLNVPAVRMLQEFGVEPFRQELHSLGFTSFNHHADYYGLSLILGGGETSIWELVDVYSRCAQKLLNYQQEREEIKIHCSGNKIRGERIPFDEGVIYSTFTAMTELIRPDSEGGWQHFRSSVPLAWKTGTSYGHRDAWAVGVTPDFTIGVWVGNSDGEGHPEIIGSSAAGSLLFKVLHTLPNSGRWFEIPHDEMVEVDVCKVSGHIKGRWCEDVDTMLLPEASTWAAPCYYHQRFYVNADGDRVHTKCASEAFSITGFQLPPTMAYYYKRDHADYEELPEMAEDCDNRGSENPFALLYPSAFESIYIPQGLNGEPMSTVFKATHRRNDAKIFWHLDNEYLGDTYEIHHMKIRVPPGQHKIKLLDAQGNEVNRTFEVIGD